MVTSENSNDAGRSRLLERRRRLRRQSTDSERLLWGLLRNRQVHGAKFRRQHQLGPYILDFYCPQLALGIEADGGQHLSPEGLDRDRERTEYLRKRGIKILRFTNRDILTEPAAVLHSIWQAVEEASPLDESKGEC